jgi:hypothetical protein
MIILQNTKMNSKNTEILIEELQLYITLLNYNYVNILNNIINLKSYIINYNDMLINFIVYILNLIIIYDKKENIHKIITHICSIITEYIIISFEEKNKNSNYVFKVFDCFMFGLRKMYELYFNDICLNSNINSSNLLKSKYYSNLLPINLTDISFKNNINNDIYSNKYNNNFNELFNEFENELVEEYNSISETDITNNNSSTQNTSNINSLSSSLNHSNSSSSNSSTSSCENYITNNNIIFNSSYINDNNIKYLKLYSELYKINIHSILITNYETFTLNNNTDKINSNNINDNISNNYDYELEITDFLNSNVYIFNSRNVRTDNNLNSVNSVNCVNNASSVNDCADDNCKNYLDRFSKYYNTVNNYLESNIDIVNTFIKYIIFNIIIKYNINITEYKLIKLYKYINNYISNKYYKKCDYKNINNKLINCNIVFILYLKNIVCKNINNNKNLHSQTGYQINKDNHKLFIKNFKFIDSELDSFHNKYINVIINNKNIKIEDILLELQSDKQSDTQSDTQSDKQSDTQSNINNLDNKSDYASNNSSSVNFELRNLLHNYPL